MNALNFLESQAVIKEKRGKKKGLQKLLAFQQHLVNEKGLPPRLMLQHAAAQVSSPATQPDHDPNQDDEAQDVSCEHC